MNTVIIAKKAGTNPDQAPWARIEGPGQPDVKIGDVFQIKGQPDDVRWQITEIRLPKK